jgi:hypothetical protein
LHRRLFDAIRFLVVKKLTAILFSVMLVWMQIAPTPVCASASPNCTKTTMAECAVACGQMDCCVAHPNSEPQPAPSVPTQSSVQNQVSLLVPAIVAWTLPENPANAISSVTALPLMATGTPLYAWNCALLL